MIHSLHFKLMLGFTVVIMVSLGLVLFFVVQRTQAEIQALEERIAEQQLDRVEDTLSRYYSMQGDWQGVQSVISQMGEFYESRIVLTDSEGNIIADSDGTTTGEVYDDVPPYGGDVSVTPVENAPGTVHSTALPKELSIQNLYKPLANFLITAGVVALVVAVGVTFLISRKTLSPVRVLTGTAKKLGQGDFSQRVEVKEKGEIGELATAFNTMAGDLEKAEKLRRNLVADTAHELRTPLSNIRGYLEAVQDGVVEPDPDIVKSLHDEVLLLTRLVDDLQDLALAEAGVLKLVNSEEDIVELIERAINADFSKAVAKNISLKKEITGDIPLCNVDVHRVLQVLHNLINNAIIHTPDGGSITIKTESSDGMVRVSVVDTGEGIQEDDLPFIFERFYRADKSRARATGGHGLGLTITKRIVESMGGDIIVNSVLGEGTDFTFTIPCANS